MTVCRYFLQGNCRFGDRCRFEHTDPYESNKYGNSGARDYSSYQNRGRTTQPAQGRDWQYNNRYTENQQYYPSERSYQDSRYDYNESYNEVTIPGYYANRYSRNKLAWMSDDYKKQMEQKTQKQGNESFFNTSTPKSKTAFSFRDTNVQSQRDQPSDLHMNEQNLIDAEIIKEDVLSWEFGNQWPFTCYCPTQGKSAFPGFVDLSPEELRLEAYKAKENNTYNSYVESVEKVSQDIKIKRQMLKEPSVELMLIIEKIRRGENFSSESVVDGSASLTKLNQTTLEDMVADESSIPQNTPASGFSINNASFFGTQATPATSFSFKTTLETDSGVKSSASAFSFKVNIESGSNPNAQGVNSDIYTPMGNISKQDKEQFLAPTFTLGKIPTVPPSQEMCF